ncbi:mechanosensitive ion channel family protein [Cerasicoccus arenae]|nr:mechanosensitive ion channel family protein [Cerasicoccus arenae]
MSAFSQNLSKENISTGRGDLLQSAHSHAPIYVPECSSPQATIKSFNELAKAVGDVFKGGDYYGDVDWTQEQQLIALYGKMDYLMNTDSLAEDDRYAQINIIISQLVEILDRIETPEIESIPSAHELPEGVEYWQLPRTEISLEQLQEGPRKGDWVFSKHTMHQMDDLYARVETLPYRTDAIVGDINVDGGLLDNYIAFTGPLIPVDFTKKIPRVLRVKLFGDPIWKYLATLITLMFLGAIYWLVRFLTRFRQDKYDSPNHIGMQFRRLTLPLFMMLLLPLTINLITVDIRLRILPLAITDDILWLAFYFTAFWLSVCVANVISAIIIASPKISPFGLDASLVRLSCRLVAYLVGVWILVEGMQRLGLSLVPLIAGVSVGGLAFALAARPTLGNILGGVLIFADRPFKVGERVVINKHDGVVEEIGLRSTRIRTLDGHLLTVPNEEVSSSYVENIGQRPHVKRLLNVTLTYDTSPEKIKEAMDIIKQLLSEDEDGGKTAEDLGRPSNRHVNSGDFPPRVYFNDLNADSLNIMVIYWFTPADYFDYLAHATWFNLELIGRFNAAGIDFAFPTQTIELKQNESGPSTQPNTSDA